VLGMSVPVALVPEIEEIIGFFPFRFIRRLLCRRLAVTLQLGHHSLYSFFFNELVDSLLFRKPIELIWRVSV